MGKDINTLLNIFYKEYLHFQTSKPDNTLFSVTFDEAVEKQRAYVQNKKPLNKADKRTASEANLDSDGNRINSKKSAPTIISEKNVNLETDPSKRNNYLKPRQMPLVDINNLSAENKLLYVTGNVYICSTYRKVIVDSLI